MPTGIYKRSISYDEYIRDRSKVMKNGCINWTGSITKGGYGTFNKGDIKTTAHRAVYILKKGYILKDLEVDHLCKNTLCINIKHLDLVTNKENNRRGIKANKRKCKRGHTFDRSNTYYKPSNGCRVCRRCNAIRSKSTKRRKT